MSGRLANLISEIVTHSIDILCLTETWLRPGEVLSDIGLTEANLRFYSCPRMESKRGGGLGVLFKKSFTLKEIPFPHANSFEHVTLCVNSNSCSSFVLSLIYRPPCSSLSNFVADFDEFLERLCMSDKYVILGDFNVHVDEVLDSHVARFLDLLKQYDLHQYVREPTHSAGHTIDLIVSRASNPIINSVSVHDYCISDHCLILCSLKQSFVESHSGSRRMRCWKHLNLDVFEKDLLSSNIHDLNYINTFSCISSLVNFYCESITSIVEKHAPMRIVKPGQRRSVPWFTDELRNAIRQRRRIERQWRRTGSSTHRADFIRQRNLVRNMVKSHQRLYYEHRIDDCRHSPRILWDVINSLLKGQSSPILPSFNSDTDGAVAFASFFVEKIQDIRESFSPSCCRSPQLLSNDIPRFDHFDPVSINEAVNIINGCKPKTCPLDPIPTWIIKKFPLFFAPLFTAIANLSLSTGVFPDNEKCALITPVLKKNNLHQDDLNNYRPISNMSFLSKFIERAVSSRVDNFLFSNNLFPPFQSAYRPFHSTETIFLHLCSDIAIAKDKGLVTCIVMLDFSAAFDTVDHDILLERLSLAFNFSGVVLKWFSSYLCNRTQRVRFNSCTSSHFPLVCGVPQGSVLGPRLYSLYVSPISDIIKMHKLSYHMYADDTCLYFSFSPDEIVNSVKIVELCIYHLCDWFNANRLKVNCNKTNVMMFNLNSSSPVHVINVSGVDIYPNPTVSYLGVTLHDSFSFEKHVINVCRSSFAFLRSLYRIRRYLTEPTVVSIVNAFVLSRLDYCNSIFSFCNKRTICRLQRIQNCLARLVKNLPRRSPTSQAIKELDWLRVSERVSYKICCFVHKCLYGNSPTYIANLLSYPSSVRTLRSQDSCTLFTPTSRLVSVRPAFYFHAPRFWNALPVSLRLESRHSAFKRRLKLYLLSSN